jgi:hypothetical protein
MEEFAQRRGLLVLADFDLSKVSQFRSEWKDGSRPSAKKLERLCAFFRFAQKRKCVTENPALDLKGPKITLCPTLPFGREEVVRILTAADQYKEEMPSHGIVTGRRFRGLVLLLRYSGMRIGGGSTSALIGSKATVCSPTRRRRVSQLTQSFRDLSYRRWKQHQESQRGFSSGAEGES